MSDAGGSLPLAILGAGPIGLFAALRGRQLGLHVDVYAADPPLFALNRIESVPSQLVALLVDFNVNPRHVGVDALYTARTIQWSDDAVVTLASPSAAHVARPILEIALRSAAMRAGVHFHDYRDEVVNDLRNAHRAAACRLIDASGRAAISVARRIRPRRPIVARLFEHDVRPGRVNQHFMLAAGPDGYAYRLGTSRNLTLGVVGRGNLIAGDGRRVHASIATFAPWLLRDLSPGGLRPGASGAATVQFSFGDSGKSVPVGDAAFAHDALASQGLALGASDAIKKISPFSDRHRALPSTSEHNAIILHCSRVLEQIERSPFKSTQAWTDYRLFLSRIVHSGLQAAALRAIDAR